MGGVYRLEPNVLIVRDVTQTLMGCPELAASLEQEGGAVLSQPMTIRWEAPERLALTNAAGTIALVRKV